MNNLTNKYQASFCLQRVPGFSFLVILILIVLMISEGSAIAQNATNEPLNVQVDFACFRGDQSLTLVEIYYAFNRAALNYRLTQEGHSASYDINIKVFFNDSLLKESHWQGSDIVENMADIKSGQMINDLHQLLLGVGRFVFDVTVTDLHNQHRESKKIEISTNPWPDESLMMSDLQLALQIQKTDKKSRNIKNGFSVQPNPSVTYNTTWPVLYYYLEIYNLNSLNNAGISSYKIVSVIENLQGKVLKEISSPLRSIENVSDIVDVNKILVVSLPSGSYDLRVKVLDENNQALAEQTKLFYVYRAGDYTSVNIEDEAKREDELRRLYLSKNEEELDQEFDYVRYIASSSEEDIYDELNVEGKREFFSNFWDTKATIASSDKFLYRQQYLGRVEYANMRFSSSGKEGWRTDQGRIIIIYGNADDEEKFYGGTAQKQYEIWKYHAIEGGIEFVFLDVTGYGSFRLVHSTAKEEVQDYEWQARYLN